MFNFFKKRFKDESLDDQKKDIKDMPEALDGLICDTLPNATGEFGRSLSNPIPVNGPIGEIKYLNRLRTTDGGLLFHRLGSSNTFDIYEVVSQGGKFWDILYFDMYHPCRSTEIPKGYKFSEFHEIFSRTSIAYGTNRFDRNFPFGLSDMIKERIGGILGLKISEKYKQIIGEKSMFIKPINHIECLKRLKVNGQTT